MSWDVALMKFSQEVNKIDEIEDSIIEQLGSREDVIKILGMIFPDADSSINCYKGDL